MTDYTKAPKEILTDLINQDNLGIDLALSNVTFGVPQALVGNPTYNTSVDVTGVEEEGFTGTVTVFYNRVDLSDVPGLSSKKIAKVGPNISDLIPLINERYGVNLTPADYEEELLPALGDSAPLVAKAESLVFKGQITIDFPAVTGQGAFLDWTTPFSPADFTEQSNSLQLGVFGDVVEGVAYGIYVEWFPATHGDVAPTVIANPDGLTFAIIYGLNTYVEVNRRASGKAIVYLTEDGIVTGNKLIAIKYDASQSTRPLFTSVGTYTNENQIPTITPLLGTDTLQVNEQISTIYITGAGGGSEDEVPGPTGQVQVNSDLPNGYEITFPGGTITDLPLTFTLKATGRLDGSQNLIEHNNPAGTHVYAIYRDPSLTPQVELAWKDVTDFSRVLEENINVYGFGLVGPIDPDVVYTYILTWVPGSDGNAPESVPLLEETLEFPFGGQVTLGTSAGEINSSYGSGKATIRLFADGVDTNKSLTLVVAEDIGESSGRVAEAIGTYTSIGQIQTIQQLTGTGSVVLDAGNKNVFLVGTGDYPAEEAFNPIPWGVDSKPRIAFGVDGFLAVGNYDRRAHYSLDGREWTEKAVLPYISNPTIRHGPVAYGNGYFVVNERGSGYMYRSATGDSWDGSAIPAGATLWPTLTFGAGIFLATKTGASTVVGVSEASLSWSSVTVPEYVIEAVAFGNGVFMGVGGNNASVFTPDALNVTMQVKALPVEITNATLVAYGNGRFVVISSADAFSAISLNNGDSWTTAEGLTANYTNLVFGNGVFIATSPDATTMAISADGLNWTFVERGEYIIDRALAYGQGKFIDFHADTSELYVSEDNGTTWEFVGIQVGDVNPTEVTIDAVPYEIPVNDPLSEEIQLKELITSLVETPITVDYNVPAGATVALVYIELQVA